MKIEKEFEAELFGVSGQAEGVFEVVRQPRGSVEQSQADPIIAVVPKNSKAGLGLTLVFEDGSTVLRLFEE
jgi:hypothetical protein